MKSDDLSAWGNGVVLLNYPWITLFGKNVKDSEVDGVIFVTGDYDT